MPSLSVFGAQWGDEGKGKLIDFLAADADLVVRYQGGANAGHTVVVQGEKYVLHLVPSGILNPGRTNVIGTGVAIDPIKLLEEFDGLVARDIPVSPENLKVSARAHVIFEHHQVLDRASEVFKGSGRIGTTGRGMGPCYADKAARTGVRMSDLADPERLRLRLTAALAEKNATLTAVHDGEALDVEAQVAHYIAIGQRLAPYVSDTGALVRDAYRSGKQVLFEGAQGMLLDIDAGTYPYVTSSNTGPGGIPAGADVPPHFVDRSVGIAKAYCTRVGEGPFPSELFGEEAERLRAAGNEYGATTGRPRRCGWFDAVAMRYVLELSGAEGWICTNLDVLSGYESIPVAVAYVAEDEEYTRWPGARADVAGLSVRLESHPGWSEDITAARRFEDLPQTAQNYVLWLEELTGSPILMLSVGPGREQMIDRRP